MPYLPNDPSVYVDESIIKDLVEELSTRLRRNVLLRPLLDNAIGNRWHDFEHTLTALWSRILLQDSGYDTVMETAVSMRSLLGKQHIDEMCRDFLESSLIILPFHAAASFTELAETIAGQAIKVIGTASDPVIANHPDVVLEERR